MLSIDIFLHKIINDKECTLQDDKVPAFIRFQKILENIMDRFEKLIEDLETNEDLQKKNPKLFKAIQQFHGGCDLISNYFTLMDLHTKEIADIKEELKKIDYNTLEELADTHILSNIGLIDKINYVTTGQIKYSLFTKEKQLQLIKNNNLNETLLQEKFHEITVGSSIKFSCYHDKYKLPTSGHSVLIHKKNNDEFFIIDSAHKPHVKLLNATDSSAALNHIFTSNKFDKVAFIDNNAYINKLNTNCINLRYKDEVTNIKKVEDPNKRKGFLLP